MQSEDLELFRLMSQILSPKRFLDCSCVICNCSSIIYEFLDSSSVISNLSSNSRIS